MVLTRTWLMLVGLTLVALVFGRPGGQGSLGAGVVALVLLASCFKAVLILRNFLDLRRAGSGWQAFFYLYLVVIAAGLLGAYVLAGTGAVVRVR